MSKQISPLPWQISQEHDYEIHDAQGDYLALMMEPKNGDEVENTAFIVKAVNNHDALAELARMIVSPECSRTACVSKARAALAAAEA